MITNELKQLNNSGKEPDSQPDFGGTISRPEQELRVIPGSVKLSAHRNYVGLRQLAIDNQENASALGKEAMNTTKEKMTTEPKTVELSRIIEGAHQGDDLWVTAYEAPEVINQWIAEAKAGDYSVEIDEILHQENCYQELIAESEDYSEGCQCSQYSADHNPIYPIAQ